MLAAETIALLLNGILWAAAAITVLLAMIYFLEQVQDNTDLLSWILIGVVLLCMLIALYPT